MRLLTTLFLLFPLFSAAQSHHDAGSKQMALGGQTVLVSDVWAVTNSPAALTELKGLEGGIWGAIPYGITTLNQGAFAAAAPLKEGKGGSIGGCFTFYSMPDAMQQMKLTAAYALKMNSKVSFGASLNLLYWRQPLYYGSRLIPYSDVSLLYHFSESFSGGLRVSNPSGARLAGAEEYLPTRFSAAVRKRVGETVVLLAEAEHQMRNRTAFRLGLDYIPSKRVSLRFGLSTLPVSLGTGLSVRFSNFRFDVAVAYHPILGPSPSSGFIYTQNWETE